MADDDVLVAQLAEHLYEHPTFVGDCRVCAMVKRHHEMPAGHTEMILEYGDGTRIRVKGPRRRAEWALNRLLEEWPLECGPGRGVRGG